MSRIRRLLAILVLLALIAFGWLWWNQPQPVDMAANVPADSLVYLETNSLTDIAKTLAGTDAWRQLEPYLGAKTTRRQNRWLTFLLKTTGIGSTPAVIAARAQAAFVLLDLNAVSNGDTLEYKPQAALVVETHTSATRIKPVIEKIIGDLANLAYATPRFERASVAGSELEKWVAPDGVRHIIASFDGSVVVVGNDERAVLACLAARRGERPSLQRQPDLEEMRSHLHSSQALAFGFVSSANTSRLVSDSAPLLLGKLADNSQLQKILGAGAGKVLGNVGWSARPFAGGIEDNYFLALKPGVVSHLRGPFTSAGQGLHQALEFLPTDTYSVSTYNLRDPAAAWASLSVAVSAQVDALSAVIFTAGFRALLVPYGIDDPDSFLKAIKPEVLTVRLGPGSDRAILIAGVADANVLHQFVTRRFGATHRSERIGDSEIAISPEGGFAASFAGDYFLLGSPDDVRRCLTARANHENISNSAAKLSALTHYLDLGPVASIVTYTKDTAPWGPLSSVLGGGNGPKGPSPERTAVERVVEELPYATTETTLGENGFERRTRSAFGQFGSLLSLVAAQSANGKPE